MRTICLIGTVTTFTINASFIFTAGVLVTFRTTTSTSDTPVVTTLMVTKSVTFKAS